MPSINSTCPYCGVGCGLRIDQSGSKAIVLGDKEHPANFGRLCSKGSALADTLELSDSQDDCSFKRLTHPKIDGVESSWEHVTTEIANKINASIDEFGRDSVAFYLSGQLLTEDYYVANKLMKGFIGTANVDTNSRLCMSSAVAAYKRSFGADAVPCSYEDIDTADLIILIGSNAAWTHPVLYQRMLAAKQARPNMTVVLIDPRATVSADLVDLHLPLKPSSDGFLFNGLLNFLNENNALDHDFITQSTNGFDALIDSVSTATLALTAQQTSLPENDLRQFFELFANTQKTISFYSMGINQSATGTDKCNAIINCHLATGKIGKEGAGPFSITGQPNAMGGREVGGLSNQLAAHMDFSEEDVDRVQRFWKSPLIAKKAGLKAVDLFDAVDQGKIKVLWIMATNPAVSLPDSNKIRKALAKCPTVIVSDITQTDTTELADIVLPASGWSEKEGTVTNSERRISRQRRFQSAPGLAKPDWQALCEVAIKMGIDNGFNFTSARDVFCEHAALSAFENNGSRDFDIGELQNLSVDEYENLKPVQWPVTASVPNGTKRLFTDDQYFTPNKRANFIVTKPDLATCVKNKHDFILNTGRLRDQWHTMTRTGNVSKLSAHDDLPFVEMNDQDAISLGIQAQDMVRLSNDLGEFLAQVKVSQKVAVKNVFSPIHWSNQFAKNAVVTSLISSDVDPISGQPQLKASAVSIEKIEHLVWTRIASSGVINQSDEFDYWAQTKTARGYVTLIGTKQSSAVDWPQWCQDNSSSGANVVSYCTPEGMQDILLMASDSNIELLVFNAKEMKDLPGYNWLATAFDQNQTSTLNSLIHSEQGETDALVCSCFGTSMKAIQVSLKSGVKDAYELGSQLGCGSKCGSCKPELSLLINAYNNAKTCGEAV